MAWHGRIGHGLKQRIHRAPYRIHIAGYRILYHTRPRLINLHRILLHSLPRSLGYFIFVDYSKLKRAFLTTLVFVLDLKYLNL